MTYIIRTYDEFASFIKAFANGEIPFLIVQGGGGLSKSHVARTASKDFRVTWLSGHCSPAAMYRTLHEGRGNPVIFDDVDLLLKNRASVTLLKQLCETSEVKTMQYVSSKAALLGVPSTFRTTSHVLMIGNNFDTVSDDVKAFLTRGVRVSFAPDKFEIFRYLEGWAQDEVVLSFIRNALAEVEGIDLRDYVTACDLHRAGLNWEQFLVAELDIPQGAGANKGKLSLNTTTYGADKVEKTSEKTGKRMSRRFENDGRAEE